MKHSKNQDKPVIDELKRQIKAENDYQEKYLAARRIVKIREKQRLTAYEKFKREQKKGRDAEEMLIGFLSKKS